MRISNYLYDNDYIYCFPINSVIIFNGSFKNVGLINLYLLLENGDDLEM
mgnify:CR=1 FL=1